jgi:hypothetical protein
VKQGANGDEKQLVPTVLLAAIKTRVGQLAQRFQQTGGNGHATGSYHPNAISPQPLPSTYFFFHASALGEWMLCVVVPYLFTSRGALVR